MYIYRRGEGYLPVENAKKALDRCLIEEGVLGFIYPFFVPGGYGKCWFLIDSSIAAEGYSWIDFAFAKKAIENFTYVQKEDGRVPLWGNNVLPVSPHHPRQSTGASALPVLFTVAYSVAKKTDDRVFAEKVFNMLYRYLEWWRSFRQDKKTGLITSFFEETFPPYLGYPYEYCGVDTNVTVATGAQCTAEIARYLNKTEEAEKCISFADEIFLAVQSHLWDEQTGLFRPRDLKNDCWGACTAEGFYMLSHSGMPDDRKAALLNRLTGSDFGWSLFPLTSVAVWDPAYTITRSPVYQYGRSWSGMVWTLINRYVVSGLITAGETDKARILAEKTVSLLNNGSFEFYDPETGTGYGAENYAWTASHAISLFIEELCGISFDAWNCTLRISPVIKDDVVIQDLVLGEYGKATVSIRDGGVRGVRLDTDRHIGLQYE